MADGDDTPAAVLRQLEALLVASREQQELIRAALAELLAVLADRVTVP